MTISHTVIAGLMKADGDDVPRLTLHFDSPVPDAPRNAPNWVEALRSVYGEDARRIADALISHLPGGLTDALLGELLSRKASLFAVPHAPIGPAVASELADAYAKVQYLVNHMDKDGKLEEGVFTFPDGDTWPALHQR